MPGGPAVDPLVSVEQCPQDDLSAPLSLLVLCQL
jgi:hypothetical protein